jgi:ATP-dependent Zn protease
MDRASEIVLENRPALDALVDALAERRYLDADEVKAILQRPWRAGRKPRQRKVSRNNRGERSR